MNNGRQRQYTFKRTTRMACSNCGEEGHLFRECPKPITSYGIIALKYDGHTCSPWKSFCSQQPHLSGALMPGTLQVLLIRRRDSLSFIEFVRGKYSVTDKTYLYYLLKGMTQAEHEKLRTSTFQQLWNAMWGDMAHTHKNDYETSGRKYSMIGPIGELLDAHPTTWLEPEWGFPKGRKNPMETDIDCAIREFHEETNLGRYQYTLLQNVPPLTETFVGSNKVSYCHKYYLAICPSDLSVTICTHNPHMAREIGHIGWFTMEEALKKLRPESVAKRDLLLRIERCMKAACVVA